MKKELLLLTISLIIGFSQIAFAGHVGVEISLQGVYGASRDWRSGSRYELWRVLSDKGYSALASDVELDVAGGTPSANYHAYKNSFWQTLGDYSAKLITEVAAWRNRNRFGWYEKGNTGIRTELFAGPDGAGATADFTNANQVGFWLNPLGIPGHYY